MATLLLGTTIGGYAAIHAGNIASQSVNYASSAGSVAWSNVTGKPTLLSQFTNDLGNYGSWITASYLDDYTRGSYRVISDYGGNTTWYLRGDGQFVWGRSHDWSYSFRLNLPTGSQNNTTWAYIGQQDSNAASGTWRGLRVRKYNGGSVDGDLSAGAFYIGDTRKDQNWDTAYGWGNHASAGYATTSYVTTQIANLVASAPSTLDTLNELAAALGNDAAFSTTVTTALGNRLRIDTGSQGLNSTQQGYGRTNLGLGSAATYAAGDFALASHNHSGTYLPLGGSWMADFASYGFTRQAGYSVVGGEWVLMSNNAQVSTLIDGSYYAGENGGFYSLNNANNYTSRKGFYNDGTYANFNTPIYVTGDIVTSSAIYPGFNNGASGSQTSYYFYGNTSNSGIRTNGNLLVNSDIYLGTRGQWLSTYLNQNVRTDSSPTFSSVYFGGSQLTTSMVNGLSNMLGVTTLPYSCDIVVNGDPDKFYAVQFWGGDQDVWRRIIIKRGYGEQAPWDPIGTGVHHGGLLLDWEGNFGGWGGAEYADRIRVFNESYTNVCADMFIYSHSMGYVFMLRGGGAIYHLFSDQAINGFYQSGSPDILYSSATLSYDDAWSGTNQYDVYAPAPLGLGQVNSSRIDGLRTKKQSLLDGRYLRQGVDISGIGTITTTNSYATNFFASNAFYLNGASYFLNSTNGGIYTNARFESATLLVAPGGNSSQWNTAYGWGNHASAGYVPGSRTITINGTSYDLTANRSWTISSTDNTKLPLAGGTMSGRLTLSSISGVSQTVPNDYGAYLHLGSWGVGRTDPSAVLVNTAYRADYADSLFDMNISRFTNNSGYITSSGSISGSAGSVSGLTLNSSANGINPDNVTQNQIGYNTSVSLFGQTDGGLYSSAYNSSWIHQIYGDFRTGQIAVRGKNSGTWQAWRTVIDSGNIGSQSVNYANSAGSASSATTATYATSATRLYASDSPYRYTDANPYYLYMNYDGGSYWELKVSPATPGTVRVAYANSAGSASTSSQVTVNYNNDSNSTYQLLWGSGNSVYGTGGIYVNPYSDVVYARGGYISPGNAWGTADSAFFPNGITTAGSDNWIYGHTYIGNAPANGNGHEFWSNGNQRSTGHHYLDANYGQTIVGLYSSTRYQGVWSMGDSYKLPLDGSSTGSLYGLAWSHPNAGGVAANLNTHGLLVMENGTFLAAVSGSIRARDDMRAPYSYAGYSARVGEIWGYGGLYRSSGDMMFGTENGGWRFHLANSQKVYIATDGNIWMSWAGAYISTLLDGKSNTGHTHDDRYYTESESDSRYLYYRGVNAESDFQRFQDGVGEVRFDQVNNYNNLSNAPGGYNYGGVLSMRGDNFGFQLWGSHTGDFYYKTQWSGDNYTGWRQVITSLNIGSQSVSYASTAGSLSSMNISQFSNNSGYVTSSGSVNYASSAGSTDLLNSFGATRDNARVGYGVKGFYNWSYDGTYANGITIGSHPGDQNYGFQLFQYMWNDRTYTRRYNYGWQSYRTLLTAEDDPYAYNMNQYVRTSDSVTFTNIYNNGWFRNNNNLEGLYSQPNGVHFYSSNGTDWNITGSGGSVSLLFRANHQSTVRGYIHGDTSSNFGLLNNQGGWAVRCYAGGGYGGELTGSWTATGDLIAYSDERVKTNISTIDNALNKVLSLRGVTYERTDGLDQSQKIGVIAQEVQKILPQVVHEQQDGMLGVSYGNMVGVLIEAIKEQQKEIEELKAKLN